MNEKKICFARVQDAKMEGDMLQKSDVRFLKACDGKSTSEVAREMESGYSFVLKVRERLKQAGLILVIQRRIRLTSKGVEVLGLLKRVDALL